MKQTTRKNLRTAALLLSGAFIFGGVAYADTCRFREAKVRETQLRQSPPPESKPEWKKQKLLEADRNLMDCGKLATSETAKNICLVTAQLERANVEATHERATNVWHSAHLDASKRIWSAFGAATGAYCFVAAGILYLFRRKLGQDDKQLSSIPFTFPPQSPALAGRGVLDVTHRPSED